MSSIRDVIAKLKAAGVADAVILSVVEDIDGMLAGAQATAGPSKGAERTRRWREKRQASQNVTGDVTGDVAPSPPDGPPSPPAPPLPPLNPPAPSSPRPERGCALPTNWQPTRKHFDLGRQLGRDARFVEQQAESMREWAGANRNRAVARKADWDLTFTAWLKREAAKGQRGPPGGRRTFGDIVDEGLAEIAGQANGIGHRETEQHDGPTLDLVAGHSRSDQFDLQSPDRDWRRSSRNTG